MNDRFPDRGDCVRVASPQEIPEGLVVRHRTLLKTTETRSPQVAASASHKSEHHKCDHTILNITLVIAL
ncbi:hypothetical protein [Brasilonema bromeliae]|uniref:hypothetical protein n=1 Tax=Brasilonema bromeliae TaxID=383615 RepID=UPI00145ECE09|nr:hypothetical protein [Brasilonema bromeliae]